MNKLKSHILREYKKNGMIKVARRYAGSYIIKVGGYTFTAENKTTGAIMTNEWIVLEDGISGDNYVGHWNSLLEAQFDLVQIYS